MRRIPHRANLVFLALLLTSCTTPQPQPTPSATGERPTFTTTVLSVTDGDTVVVNVNGSTEKVRLSGIDCPESAQPFGMQATQLTKQLTLKKQVTVTDFGRDKYHRMIGQIVLSDGRNLNQELVREGFCWWYQKYAPDDTVLKQLELEAKEAKRGVWSDAHPIPPWDWRHQNR